MLFDRLIFIGNIILWRHHKPLGHLSYWPYYTIYPENSLPCCSLLGMAQSFELLDMVKTNSSDIIRLRSEQVYNH